MADCTGTLVIDGVSMHTPAWNLIDLIELWMPAELRGGDRLIPNVDGLVPYMRKRTATTRRLPMVIRGEVDRLGAAQSDYWEGLEANITYLRTNVVDPTGTGDGTRAAVLTMPSGATRSADIHVLGLTAGDKVEGFDAISGRWGVVLLATLDISIPAGVFA